MALSSGCKKHLKIQIGNAQNHIDELVAAIDSNDPSAALAAAEAAQADATEALGRQAAEVLAIGPTVDLVGVDGTGSNAAPLVETEARLDAIEAKIDAVIAALKAAGLMLEA